jgi:energy-coupling factor transporter ATP-binding protein EcfA2
LPSLTVAQNIALPLRLDGRRMRRSTVREVAARVGLETCLRHRPSELSGGQPQRVAIARAPVTRPEVVFADEPTGALDRGTGHEVLARLREVVDTDGHTVVMVTHDPVCAAHAGRVILLADGRVTGTLEAPSADEVARLTGATTRQVRSMARWEAPLIITIGLGLGLAIAATALLPLSHALNGTLRPYVPPIPLAEILGTSALLAMLSLALPTRRALRTRPVEAIAIGE